MHSESWNQTLPTFIAPANTAAKNSFQGAALGGTGRAWNIPHSTWGTTASLSDTATRGGMGWQGKPWVSYSWGPADCPKFLLNYLKTQGGLEPTPSSLLLSAISKALWIFINPKVSTTGKHWKLPSAWLALFFVAIVSELSTCIFKQINQQITLILLDIFSYPFLLPRSCLFLFLSTQKATSEKHSSSVVLTKCERAFTYLYLTDPSSLFKSQIRNNIFLSC